MGVSFSLKMMIACDVYDINLLMYNPEEYIRSCLNSSKSKYAHAFAKADRFDRTRTLYHSIYSGRLRRNTRCRR